MSSSVEQIKERLHIEDVIGSYIKLERAGASLKARCPFHNEKTPSFFVSPERGNYYCFGCGAKGDMFTFVEECEGIDFVGALKILAEKAGVTLEKFASKETDVKARLYALLETATFFLSNTLAGEEIPLAYLKKRGLTEKTIRDWKIGYVRDEWRSISDYLRSKGFLESEMERAGITKTENGSTYDRFRGRIMFPIFDSAGRVIAFSGRILHDDGKSAKYLNSPQTEIFDKSKVLYGYDRAKQSIRKFDFSILVEGQVDLLMSHQAGFTNAVASSGTALTIDHLNLLKRISNKIIMSFDSDTAGAKAAERGWTLALSLGMEVKVAQIPKGLDPAELILKEKELFKGVLKNSMHLIDFLLVRILEDSTDERKIGLELKNKVLPYLYLLESNIERSHYISKIHEKTGIPEEAIREDLKRVKLDLEFQPEKSKENKTEAQHAGTKILKKGSAERQLAGIFAKKDDEALRKKIRASLGEEQYAQFENEMKDLSSELAFEAEAYYGSFPEEKMKKEKDGLLLSLEEDMANNERIKIAVEIAKSTDEERKKYLMVRSMELSRQIERIKKDKQKFL